MIRFAQKSDRAQRKELWATVFGDPPDVIDGFFARRLKDEDMLVFLENGILCGMLSLLPLTLVTKGRTFPACYVYAVATAPAFRGRGIATALLERAHNVMRARGDVVSTLVPASEGLFRYYAKRGYQTAFTIQTELFHAAALNPIPPNGTFAACTPRAYALIRDAAFSGCGLYARWDACAVAFACEGMHLTKLTLGTNVGCALWEEDAQGILVRELATVGLNLSDAMALLHGQIGATSYRVRLPGNTTPFGMLRWLISDPPIFDQPGYLSLALD